MGQRKETEGKDKYILEYLNLCIKYTNSFASTEVNEAEVKQIIKRIHELRYALGMKPICLRGIKGEDIVGKQQEGRKKCSSQVKELF